MNEIFEMKTLYEGFISSDAKFNKSKKSPSIKRVKGAEDILRLTIDGISDDVVTNIRVYKINNLFPTILNNALKQGKLVLNFENFDEVYDFLLTNRKKYTEEINFLFKLYINLIYGFLYNGNFIKCTSDSINPFDNFIPDLIFEMGEETSLIGYDVDKFYIDFKNKNTHKILESYLNKKNIPFEKKKYSKEKNTFLVIDQYLSKTLFKKNA